VEKLVSSGARAPALGHGLMEMFETP
jgi:hypothetical protein